MITLNNHIIQAKISEMGAELCSLKFNDDPIEYIWNADPKVWARHAPILFPIVGKVVDGKYVIDNTTYSLGQHGFARDMEFVVKEHTGDKVSLELMWNANSLKLYPYHFALMVTYTLMDAGIKIDYKVINKDRKNIYFSIGAHPGFNCPLIEGETFEDYYFEFEKKETAMIYQLTENGLFKREQSPCLNEMSTIDIHKELFKNDALVFENLRSKKISLRSKKSNRSVSMDFDGFPFLGLWSKPTGAPFVCIEPWFGHADYDDFKGDFSEKEDNLCLENGKNFDCSYRIDISRG